MIFYLLISTFLTPYALHKSRLLLSQEQFNSFLPTVKMQQFSDSFKGFTFIVERKKNNEVQNIFLFDKGRNLKNLSSNITDITSTTIIARDGLVDKKKFYLFNGQIISTKKDNSENEIIKFEQLNINLSDLSTSTIKKPKIQETSTIELLKCVFTKNINTRICNNNSKKEMIPALNRRLVLPFYIPVISLLCSFLLLNSKKKYLNKISIFVYSFVLLLFTEITIKYTGMSEIIRGIFFVH